MVLEEEIFNSFPIFIELKLLIRLSFSGVREGVNKLAVLKFQSNPSSLQKNVKIWNSGKSGP